MKSVRAFGDRFEYLPSIPMTAAAKSQYIGYPNTLLEVAAQSQAFVLKFTTEYGKLTKQIKLMGKTKELSHSYMDSLLEAVVNGEDVPTHGTRPSVTQQVAAGAPGQLPVDAMPSASSEPPEGSSLTDQEPTVVLLVTSEPEALEPAGDAPPPTFQLQRSGWSTPQC